MIGIGFRKDFAQEFLEKNVISAEFVEVAPENWLGIGGYWKKQFLKVIEKYPLFLHGLSLSVGSPDELDMDFLKSVKKFLKETNAQIYSEHLSYAKCDNAHLYDLLPIPFTHDAVKHVSKRIRQVQDFLEQKITLEIVSYYTPVAPEMTEIEFICSILKEAECDLLLDVNNVYVNSFNHKYNACHFIDQLPLETVSYVHMAGHEQISPDLIIDTHGSPIIENVYSLFEYTMKKLNREVPVLLERDFNIPDLTELEMEIQKLRHIQQSNINHQSVPTNSSKITSCVVA